MTLYLVFLMSIYLLQICFYLFINSRDKCTFFFWKEFMLLYLLSYLLAFCSFPYNRELRTKDVVMLTFNIPIIDFIINLLLQYFRETRYLYRQRRKVIGWREYIYFAMGKNCQCSRDKQIHMWTILLLAPASRRTLFF